MFVIGTLETGGAEHQMVELARNLGDRFECSVCCLSDSGPLEADLAKSNIPVTSIGLRGVRQRLGLARLAAIGRFPGSVYRLLQHVRQTRPDVIHAFLFHSYVLSALVGRLTGVPVVIASRRSLANFKAGRLHYAVLERVANRWTDLIVANSEAVRQDTIRVEHLAPDRIVVIHNGVDPSRFARQPATLRHALAPGANPVVLVVANLIPYKGHRYFLDAWQDVCRQWPTAVALLAGDGPARADCERQVSRLAIEPHVKFLGVRRDVPDLLAACDLLVHPSLEEGFCNALLEAMAAGRPVVATAVGGNPEAVQEGTTGLLVPPADSGALTRAMLDVLGRPDRGREFGDAGQRVVDQRFQLSTMVAAYEQTYLSLLNDHRLSSRHVRHRRAV